MTRKKYVAFICAALFTPLLTIAQQRTVQVLSATVKDQRIENAEVLLQKNGAQTVVGHTDRNGNVSLTPAFADNNEAAIIIKKPGYSTLVAKCPCNGLTYAISPNMQNLDGLRIVLSWGARPADLDVHLAYGSNHIYFDHKDGANANLDVDDVDSYGPETITVEQRENMDYVFAVHDFSDIDQPATYNLGRSQAKVFVYIGTSLVRTYYVPQNMQGNLWTVFRINANGEMQDINKFSRINVEADKVNNVMLHPDAANYVSADMGYNLTEAQAYNAQGENAYHSQQYENAIALYNAAIQADPDYGQAYGNLGLAYKKLGSNAEAIWANRKAIQLANGSNANVVRAGSYYNIGRIYEEKAQFAQALQQYQLAKTQNQNPVYDNAITRMQGKLRR